MTAPARVALVALRPTVRSMSWLPLLCGAASAGVGMWLIDPTGGDVASLTALRVAAFLLAAGAAFALDDPAATTLAASPSALAVRRGHRLSLLVAAWSVLWALALAVTEVLSPQGGIPLMAASVEAAGMLALAVAAAAVAAPHVEEGRGGVVAGPALTLAMLAALMAQFRYPRWVTLFAFSPSAPEWHASHTRWALLFAAGIVALVIASLDPARGSARARLTTSAQGGSQGTLASSSS